MPGIQELKNLKRAGPYSLPVRVLVAATSPIIQYGDSEEKKLKNLAVADETDYARAVCFDAKKFDQLCENKGIVLRNIISKNGEIIITKQTRIFQTTAPTVPEKIMQEAKDIICPPTPPTISIAEAKRSPEKQRVSVKGKVTNEGLATTVMSRNRETLIKTIVVEDSSDNVKIALWREIANKEIHPGEFVEITNVVTNNYDNQIQMSSTQYTNIKVTEAPEETIVENVIGFSVSDDNQIELMLQSGALYTVQTKILEDVDADYKNKFPMELKMVVKGTEVTKIY